MPRAGRPPSRWLFMSPGDVGLFLRSARTDAAIAKTRATQGARAAFESAYTTAADPWASGDRRYFYQRWKYEGLIALLPPGRRYARALELGSGIGLLTEKLTRVADDVLGLDIAQAAVDRANFVAAGRTDLRFEQADVTDLDPALNEKFDLVVIADTLYYLDATDDRALKTIAARVARLLAPGGICLLANHYFFSLDADSRLSRRIHDAFAWSPGFDLLRESRHPFYLASLLARSPVAASAA